jgi:hypothetical protein
VEFLIFFILCKKPNAESIRNIFGKLIFFRLNRKFHHKWPWGHWWICSSSIYNFDSRKRRPKNRISIDADAILTWKSGLLNILWVPDWNKLWHYVYFSINFLGSMSCFSMEVFFHIIFSFYYFINFWTVIWWIKFYAQSYYANLSINFTKTLMSCISIARWNNKLSVLLKYLKKLCWNNHIAIIFYILTIH